MPFTAPDEELTKPPETGGFSAPDTDVTPDPMTGAAADVGFSAPKDDLDTQAHILAQQDHSAIYQHAAQNPQDFETAFQADKLRRARPLSEKAGEFVSNIPSGIGSGAKGVWNFATGVLDANRNLLEGGYRQATGDERYRTNQAQATLSAQRGEETLKHLGTSLVSNYQRNAPGFLDPLLYSSPDQKEEVARMLFAQRVQQAKNEAELSQGRPMDTGAVASLYHAAGQQPSEDISPEALKAAGVDQADPGTVERMAAAGDPTMLALAAAPGLPGARAIGGGATELVGKGLQVPGQALSAVTRPLSNAATAIKTIHTLANPVGAAAIAAKKGGIKGLGAIGEALEAQGKELRTGAPSPLTTEAATASATGESALGTNIQRKIGDFAAQGAATAAGMAPLNAVLSEGDPEALAQSTAGAGVFGGTFGALARNRPLLVEAVRPHLQSEGARDLSEAVDANDPLAIKSAAYVMSLPEEARNSTLEAIGALQGLPTNTPNGPKRAKLYVLNDGDYKDVIAQKFGMQQAAMGGGRGFFIGDDGAAYVNGDYHSGMDPAQLAHTVGHEFGGHAAINIMQAMGSKGGAIYNGLVNSVKSQLLPNGRPTADFYRFVREYNRAFDPSGQTHRLSFNDPEAIEEFIAEQAGQIMAGRGAGELALPQTIQDKINQGVGQFMGGMLGVDKRKVGTPTNFGRQEVGQLTQAVQDTLGQVVGMKLRGGAEIPEPAKTTQRRIDELNAVLAKPRPPVNGPLEETQRWNIEQKAARTELSQLQTQPQGAFPAAGQAPVPPSKPGVIVSPDSVTQDAIKGAMAFGIPNATRAAAAVRAANQQHGEPILDPAKLALGAYRVFSGGTVKPGEFKPKPVETTPVPVPSGTFSDETGTKRTITGTTGQPPRVGDVVATRDGEIRRVTRAIGDTVDTARTADPLNARGTKTHKLGDVQALAHDYATPTEAPAGQAASPAPPAMIVKQRGDADFIVVDAAGNPVDKQSFASETAAKQSIARRGKASTFGLPPSPNGNDILDSIMENGGINLSGLSKEERDAYFPHKGIWRNALTSDNPSNTPDEIARLVAPSEGQPGHGDGDMRTMFDEIGKAITARNQFREQQAAADKQAKAAQKNAPNEPASPPNENGALPPQPTIAPPQPATPAEAPPGTRPSAPAAPSREAVDALVAKAEAQAVADEHQKQLKKNGEKRSDYSMDSDSVKERIHDAKVNAVLDAIGDDPNGIHRVTMPDGSEKRVGDFDPENPYHQALAELGGGLSGPALDSLTKMQEAKGRTQFIRYRSALSSAENGPELTDKSMANRRAEYEADPASERTEGTIQHKVIIPVQTTMTKDGKPQSTFFVLDNLLHNAESVREFTGQHPELGPFPYKNEADLLRDAKTYADNHAHGWKGDGSGPMQGFPDSGLPKPDLNYRAEKIPKERFDVLNMMLADEQSGKLADRTQEVADKQVKVAAAKTDKERGRLQGVLDRTITRMKTSQEGYALGDLNNPWVDHQTGETNQLRSKLKSAGFDTNDALKSPFETLSPEHILDVSDKPIPMQEGDIPTVRPHGFEGSENMAPMGKLNAKAVRAGFLPDTGSKSAKERAKERIAERDKLHTEDAQQAADDFQKNEPETWPRDLGEGVDFPDRSDPFTWEWALSKEESERLQERFPDGEVPANDQEANALFSKAKDEFLRRADESIKRVQDLRKQIKEHRFLYMPSTGDSKPSTGEPAPEGQGPSGSQPDRPSVGGTSPKDTGAPEDGETGAERLMREAESAGLEPSLELTKSLLRGDQQAFEKLRAMIRDRTGKNARFMPDHREAARQRILSRQAA